MRLIKWLVLFLYCAHASAQVNTAFIKHLENNHLVREHRTYLNNLPANDSTAYFEAKFNLRYFNDSLFLNYYAKSVPLCTADTILATTASRLFLINSSSLLRRQWFSIVEEKTKHESYFHKIYKASLDPNAYSKNDFEPELQPSYLSYKKIYNKKPLLGSSLSIVIPGLGKLYAGKPKSALLAFLLNAGYAAQTLESGKKLGIKHPFTIVNAAVFTLFYFSNIYGSYKAITDLKKERKKQFIHDATNFYN